MVLVSWALKLQELWTSVGLCQGSRNLLAPDGVQKSCTVCMVLLSGLSMKLGKGRLSFYGSARILGVVGHPVRMQGLAEAGIRKSP